MLKLAIVADDPRWEALEDIETEMSGWANVAADHAQRAIGADGAFEAVLKLGTDEEVQELNRRFRGQDKPTNVLSFPAGEDWPENDDAGMPVPLGDIIIAFETVEREAAEQGKPFRHHLAHLVVHGILHLYGFDHEDDAEAEEMEQLERDILARLGMPSPYDEPGLSDI